jgi:predicted acylesterase/phospholipase RssA
MGLGFAFSGCSGRLAFHLGAATRLGEVGIHPQVTTGASSGALIAGATALNRLEIIHDNWRETIGLERLFQPRRLLKGHWPFTMSHILRKGLDEWFGDTRLSDVPIPIGIPVTLIGLRGRRSRLLTNSDSTISVAEAIAASSFIPGFYSRMIPIDRRPTFDGAWLYRTPVHEAHDLGATKVIAFVANPKGALLAGSRGTRVQTVPAHTRLLYPPRILPVQGFDFDETKISQSFHIGREAAEQFLRQNDSWISSAY